MKKTIDNQPATHHRPSPTQTKCQVDGANHMPNTTAADGLYEIRDRDTGLLIGTAFYCAECAEWIEDEEMTVTKIGEA